MPASADWRRAGWTKAFVVALVLFVGALAVRHSLGMTLAQNRPELALQIDRENAAVLSQAALAFVQGTDPKRRGEARNLARAALARDAGNVNALAAFGLASDQPKQIAAVFTAAGRLSRRNLIVQIWMIENAVAKGDVSGALHQYDIALRTSRAAPSMLFPVLVDATSNDALLPAIAKTLARRPLWSGLYLQQLAQSGKDLHRIAMLFILLKRQGVPTGAAADTALYTRLQEAQLFDDAWKVYASDHHDAQHAAVRSSMFGEDPVVKTPFDWQLSDNEFVTARIEQTTSAQGELIFTTAAGEGGDVARQTLSLTPGTYTLQIAVGQIEAADAQLPYFRLVCLPSGTELVRKPLMLQGASGARFLIPSSCPAQTLSIVAQPASGLGAVKGTVRSVRLARTG
jgi:hypothetical protein